MVEERRVTELEIRMDELVARIDGVEAAVADFGPRNAEERPGRFEAPTATGPSFPHPGPGTQALARAAPAREAPAPRVASRMPRLPDLQRRPRMKDVLGDRSLEDLLGGRVLAWVGGLAVLIGVAFLFAVGVSRGWIGEGARTLMSGTASTLLLGLGFWLHERRGRTDAALAAVATGISALFVTVSVGAEVYGVLPAPVALGLALAVGAVATSLAVRWESRGVAALGILGALVSPVLAGAPSEVETMAILLIAAGSAVGVLLRQRWDWLSFGVFLITTPQWVAYLAEGQPSHAVIAVLTGFGLIGALAAVGYELRLSAQTIRPSSAFLLSLNAIALAAAGWIALAGGGEETVAKLWLVALAVVHVGIGLWTTRSQLTSHAFGLLSLVIGTVLADVAFTALLDGPVRALGWAAAAVTFAVLARRLGGDGAAGRIGPAVKDETVAALGLGVHVALALLQAMTSDAPPALLDGGGAPRLGAAISLAGVAAACLVSARLAEAGRRELRVALDAIGLAVLAYLTALTLDGAALTLAWSLQAAALTKLGSRTRDTVAAWGGRAHLLLAALQALAVVAPPSAVAGGLDRPLAAIVALGGLALAAAVCASLTSREQRAARGALEVVAMGAAAYLAAVTLDGAALVGALAAGAVCLAEIARRFPVELTAYGALAYLGGALAHVLVFEAPPFALVEGVEEPAAAAIALVALAGGAIACGRPGGGPATRRRGLLGAAAVTMLYLASVLVVTPFQPGSPAADASLLDLDVRQQGQVLLSVLWSLAGVGALVVGLRRDMRVVRLGALALLLVTVGKVFMFDLATLTSIYRVASFIGLGLVLLTAAFVWQRMRPRPLPDMREVPAGVR